MATTLLRARAAVAFAMPSPPLFYLPTFRGLTTTVASHTTAVDPTVAATSTSSVPHSQLAKSDDSRAHTWVAKVAGAVAALAGTAVGAALWSSPTEAHSPLERSSEEKVQGLMDWLQARGATLTGVSIAPAAVKSGESGGAGLGVYATGKSLRGGGGGWMGWLLGRQREQLVARFPVAAAISPQRILNAGGEGASVLGELLETGVVDEATVVILHLVAERQRGRDSALAPWLATLPTHFDTPIFYRARDLEQLKGTPLHGATQAKQRQLAAMWARLQPAMVEICSAEDITGATPTLDDFLWAYSVYWSRALSMPVLTGEWGPGGVPEVEVQVAIVPGLDFCNHSSAANALWTVLDDIPIHQMRPNDGPGDIKLSVLASKSLRPGTEVTISYGDKSNEELLFAYGFTEEGNPHDRLMLHCPIPPQDEWDETMRSRMLLLMARGLSPQLFLPALQPPKPGATPLQLPSEVWDTLEVFVMNKRDLAAAVGALEDEDGKEGVAGPRGEPTKLGARMAVLSTLVRLLELRVEELEGEGGTGPLETDFKRLQDGVSDVNTHNALVYRSGQKRLARGYLLAAQTELQHVMRELARRG